MCCWFLRLRDRSSSAVRFGEGQWSPTGSFSNHMFRFRTERVNLAMRVWMWNAPVLHVCHSLHGPPCKFSNKTIGSSLADPGRGFLCPVQVDLLWKGGVVELGCSCLVIMKQPLLNLARKLVSGYLILLYMSQLLCWLILSYGFFYLVRLCSCLVTSKGGSNFELQYGWPKWG